MRLVLFIASALPLMAQTAPPAAAPVAEATSPVPTEAPWLAGWVDLGYRWETGVGGSFNTYRSLVDLGSGPKLLGTEFSLTDPRHRLFDQIQVRAYNLGDDPYETVHLEARKVKLYDFNADYRNMALFDYLPSYADPLLSRGIVLNEQSFDTRRRSTNLSVELLPGNWIVPYLSFDHDSGSGAGATTFVTNGNEFPVPNTMNDLTNLYRAGVRIQLRRFHLTLEEGGTTFVNNQSVYQSPGSENYGNLATPLLGQTLSISSLLASYGIRGSSTFSKGLLTANPVGWLDLYGQFLFSQPSSNVSFQQSDAGNLLLQTQVLFYNSQQYLVTAAAKLPRTSASFGAEVRPFARLRLVESWLTDRLHDSGSAASVQTLTNPTLSEQMSALLRSSLASNYNQAEIELFFNAASRLTVHGGYRYVWGDASDAILPLEGLAGPEQGHLRRNVAIGGLSYHPSQKISLSGEVEAASSGGAYFRTSLYDYRKVRAQARYQVAGSLNLFADINVLSNHNPLPGIKYDYLGHQESLSFMWAPRGGRNWDFQGSYSRSTVYSNLSYLEPEILAPEQSLYRDNAHIVTALFNANLPRSAGLKPRISAGGSLFISSGSRPTQYYLPTVKLTLPLSKKFSWFAEWSYYGYGEAFYLYEGFRTNIVTTGLRLTR